MFTYNCLEECYLPDRTYQTVNIAYLLCLCCPVHALP